MSGLFNSTVLDVAIGLVFVYLLLAVLCTTANEWLAGIFATRSTTLRQGIRGLLDNQPLGGGQFLEAFYQHPLISGMMQNGDHPSYLASRAFATAVMDLATPAVTGPITLADLVAGINAMPDGDVKKALAALVANVSGDLTKAQQNIERWFDDTMDRVSGWYKRTAQKRTVVLAVLITVLANADTVRIARTLWLSPTERSKIVEQARQAPAPVAATSGNGLSPAEESVLGDMIGWKGSALPPDFAEWLLRILGWIFTAVAVSLGAPFWFDTLSRFVNLRSSGVAPPKQP